MSSLIEDLAAARIDREAAGQRGAAHAIEVHATRRRIIPSHTKAVS
ncbi:MAG: hypothetical protein JWP92_1802 [Caulobacter sp.]|nr:hypothetical protein [Caulobacter sp.]